MSFISTKVFDGFSCVFRQWKAEGTHCRFLHGYGVSFKVWFKGEEVVISSARNELIEELKFIANELSDELYVEAINLDDVYKDKFEKNNSFHEAGIIKAIENVKAIKTFTNIDLEVCEKEASDSLKEFDRINQLQEINFEEFIDSYNSKI